ncbi:DUF3298 domain-containing protein [Patescibacteria group bacterium]
MKKIIFVVFISILLSGCSYLTPVVNETEPAPVINETEPISEEVKIDSQTKTIDQSNDSFLASASYPEFSMANKEIEANLNAGIKNKVDVLMNNFLDIADTDEPIMETLDLGSQTDIGYEIYSQTEEVISIGFSYYSYISGAAHGFNGYESFSYDLVNDQQIELVDIFVSDSNYLEALSYMATEYFDNKFEPDTWFTEGVEPDSVNFSKFVLTQDAIIFLFDNYAVVPYVLGLQEWEVKYEDIFALLNEDGPVKYFK